MMKKLIFSILLSLVTSLSFAAGLPAYYPDFFRDSGIVSEIDVGNSTMVVHDTRVYLSRNTNVYTPRSRSASLLNVKPGALIGYKYQLNDKSQPVVTEIWVLPDNHPTLPLPR